MRNSLFCLALILVGCGGSTLEQYVAADTGTPPVPPPVQPPVQPPVAQQPEITGLTLSPDTVAYMEGDGTVAVTAVVTFSDAESDLQTLWIRMPDSTLIECDLVIDMQAGAFAENMTMSTDEVGTFPIEFWLVDQAGVSSDHVVAAFIVAGEAQSLVWTNRLDGLQNVLNDVTWDGGVFIAVGNGGLILTSADGIDWEARQSATDTTLNAVAAYGHYIVAVGNEIIQQSTDHGETWSVMLQGTASDTTAVAVNSSHIVISGMSYGLAAPYLTISTDRGDTWQFVDFWNAVDLIYRGGLFVGVLDTFLNPERAWVTVSADGETWNDMVIREGGPPLFTAEYDGSQFIVAGADGAVFASFDGFNWTELQTPVDGVDYLSSTWNGSKLVLAGGSNSMSEVPVGLCSIDGGATWGIFNIDGRYESRGLAFGDGRFVSVGRSATLSGRGAIYTTD